MNKQQARERDIASWLKLPVEDRYMRCRSDTGKIELFGWDDEPDHPGLVCTITLQSLIAKRYPAKKKKKAVATK